MNKAKLNVVNINFFLFSSALLTSNFQPGIPNSMKTGIYLEQDDQDNWEEENFRRAQNKLLCQEINTLSIKKLKEKIEKAKIAKLKEIRLIVGEELFFYVPKTLLLYVDMGINDDPIELAKKYVRLALAIKDMYEDYDINKTLFGTYYSPNSMRLTYGDRYMLMSICYMQAINNLQLIEEEPMGDLSVELVEYYTDLVLSIAAIEMWLAHTIKKSSTDTDIIDEIGNYYENRAQVRLWGLDLLKTSKILKEFSPLRNSAK